MTNESHISARVAEELRWQTFLFASRNRISATFAERCSAMIADWASGTTSRPATVESLRSELIQLAADAPTSRGGEFVLRLAAVTGAATAVSCVPADALVDVNLFMIGCFAEELDEGLKDNDLWLEALNGTDDERMVLRAMVQHRLRDAASKLDIADRVDDLVWCCAMAFSLWTTDLEDDEFKLAEAATVDETLDRC